MEPSNFLMLAGLLVMAFLVSGSVSFSIGLVLIYNNYLWGSNGFQYDELHIIVNAVTLLTLSLYIMLNGWVGRNEDRKLKELDIKEIY